VTERKAQRKKVQAEQKRGFILDAAREVFASEGLEGASVRAIAARAGYTPAALYFHFPSKEAIYAELLRASLAALRAAVLEAVGRQEDARARFRAAAMGFYHYYARNPRELDLGFYLFRGGMKPAGLSRETDQELNAALEAALSPVAEAARELGASQETAGHVVVDVFAHATGLLLLLHTGRIRMFSASPDTLMERFTESKLRDLAL
jgi:AcrR family transcriptional regulator